MSVAVRRVSARRVAAAALTALALTTAALTSTPAAAHQGGLADSFVTRNGTRLRLQGQPFRLAGTNIYWLGLDETAGR